MAFETILQLRGTIDIIAIAGSSAGNVLRVKFVRIDKVVLLFGLFVSVMIAFRFPSPTKTST